MATPKLDEKKITFGSWKQLIIEGVPPTTRFSQAVSLCGDAVYLFGGASNNEDGVTTYHKELYALNLETTPLRWHLIKQCGDVPSAREGASLCTVGDKLYMYGGIEMEGAAICAEGLYSLLPAEGYWEKLVTTGSAPLTLSSTIVADQDKKLVTFGGLLKGVAQQSLHYLDLSLLEWTEVKASGILPPPRCDHVSVVVGDMMYVTAGSGSEELWFNDFYALDLDCDTWVKYDPQQGSTPTPRDYTSLDVISNKYLVEFGGFSGTSGVEECFSDLHYAHICSSAGLVWHSVGVSGEVCPHPRYAHSTIFYKNKLYVFAGQSTEEEFQDVWALPIQVSAEVEFERTSVPNICYSTSNPIPAPRKIVTLLPPKIPQPQDFEELRSYYVREINELFDIMTVKFQQLDIATADLESERSSFEMEKKAHYELYNKQQQELNEMLTKHKEQTDEWVCQTREASDREMRSLAEDRVSFEQARADFAKEQEAFVFKSKKLDAILKQVQGLKD